MLVSIPEGLCRRCGQGIIDNKTAYWSLLLSTETGYNVRMCLELSREKGICYFFFECVPFCKLCKPMGKPNWQSDSSEEFKD